MSIKILTPIIFIIIFSTFFLIPIPIMGLKVRVDDILILFCIPLIILHIRKFEDNKYLLPIYLFLISILISIIYGYLFLNVPFSGGDINEYIRYTKILLFAILLGYIDIQKLSNITYKIFYFGSFYIVFVGYMEYFNPILNIGKNLSLLYAGDSHILSAIGDYNRRITITGPGPNDGAILAGYLLLFNFFTYIFTNNKKNFILFLLLLSVVLFSQSRTVLAGVSAGMILSFFSIKGFIYKKIILTIFILFFAVILIPMFDYIVIGTQVALEGEGSSLLLRLESAKIAYEMFLNSPIVGYGLAKNMIDVTMDSEYLSIISRFGLFGILVSVWIMIMPILYKKYFDKFNNNANINIFYYTLLGSSIMGLFIMLTNNFITGYQSFLPFILLLVLSFRLIKYYRTITCIS